MTAKTKKAIHWTIWVLIVGALCFGAYTEAGICTAILLFCLWSAVIKLTTVISLQNDVLERVKIAMTGTLLLDKTLRDAAKEADAETKTKGKQKKVKPIS